MRSACNYKCYCVSPGMDSCHMSTSSISVSAHDSIWMQEAAEEDKNPRRTKKVVYMIWFFSIMVVGLLVLHVRHLSSRKG